MQQLVTLKLTALKATMKVKTIRARFLKDDSVLSVSEDFVGAHKAVVNEVYNPNGETVSGIDTSNQTLSGYTVADRTKVIIAE